MWSLLRTWAPLIPSNNHSNYCLQTDRKRDTQHEITDYIYDYKTPECVLRMHIKEFHNLIKADRMSLPTLASHNMSLAAHDILWQPNV